MSKTSNVERLDKLGCNRRGPSRTGIEIEAVTQSELKKLADNLRQSVQRRDLISSCAISRSTPGG